MMKRLIVAYLRVSTNEQGLAGLGIAAQRVAVEQYATELGATMLATYVEIETGRRDHLRNRPELTRALAHARRARATLVIATLDRLSRSVLVTAQLLASKVDFVACDNRHADRTTILLMALMAEHESRLTSVRTREAMAAARARGVTFGNPIWNFSPETRLRAAEGARRAHRVRTREAYADVTPDVLRLSSAGVTSAAISRYLNDLGHTTTTGGRWGVHSVQGILRRERLHEDELRILTLEQFQRVAGSRQKDAEASLPSPIKRFEATETSVPDVAAEMRGEAVAYYRVSTRMQQANGLSLEAQRATVVEHARRYGLRVLAEYVEVESARSDRLESRPELVRALARTATHRATLLIARLDRLTRSPAVTSQLQRAGVRFVACDVPFANQLTIGILAVMAEHETRLISARMVAAIAAGKAQGRIRRHVSNLKPADMRAGVIASAKMRIARSRRLYAEIEPVVAALRHDGLSLAKVAQELNARGYLTQRTTNWSACSVTNLMRRVAPAIPERTG